MQGFVPPSLGVALPQEGAIKESPGLQDERVERDAWRNILSALTRLKEARDLERDQKHGDAMTTD